MLTADQTIAVRKLLPKVQDFLGYRNGVKVFTDEQIQYQLEEALSEGYSGGMVKMELFCVENFEGLRVQYGNTHQYFRVKAEGRMT